MKKLITTLFLMTALLPMVASADPVEIDGIWYHLNPEEKSAEVTYGDWPTNYYDSRKDRYSGDIEIPASVVYESTEYNVTCIGDSAFTYCVLNSITIPNSVTSIGKDAFKDSYNMKSVHISDLEAWCKIAFSTCDSNPVCYAHRLYLNGVEVKDVVIPESLTSIGNYTFYNCFNLTSVTIPNSVTSIGDGAFYDCI